MAEDISFGMAINIFGLFTKNIKFKNALPLAFQKQYAINSLNKTGCHTK